MILRRIARGRGVRLPQNPWGMDDDDDDDDDVEEFKPDFIHVMNNIGKTRGPSVLERVRKCCGGTVFEDFTNEILSVLEDYKRLDNRQVPPITQNNMLRCSDFNDCEKNVAIIFGQCFGKVELINEFVPNNFNVMIRGAAKAVLRNTKEDMSSTDLWRKHVVVVSATTTCSPFELDVRTFTRNV